MEWFDSKLRILGLVGLLVAIGYLGYADWARKDYAWRKGYLACIERGHAEAECRSAVSQHNAQCFAMTGPDEFSTRGEIMNVDRYLQCIFKGPGPFRREMRRLKSEARSTDSSTTTVR